MYIKVMKDELSMKKIYITLFACIYTVKTGGASMPIIPSLWEANGGGS